MIFNLTIWIYKEIKQFTFIFLILGEDYCQYNQRLQSMNISRASQKKSSKKQVKRVIVITYDQFQQLLKSISPQQAQELKILVKDHALIQHDTARRLFQGSDDIMEEIQYLVNLKAQSQFVSIQSSFSQVDQTLNQTITKKQILLSYCVDINQKNYASAMKELISITAIPHNVFQIVYGQKEVVFANQQELKQLYQIIITNRCLNNSQIYIVFQAEAEILSLLAFIDIQFRLCQIQDIIRQMQNRKENIFSINLDDKQLYLYKTDLNSDWNKLISCINKTAITEIVILMRYKYFQNFVKQRSYFSKPIKIVMDEAELHLQIQKVGQNKVLQNNMESMYRITNLIIQILSRSNKYLKYNDFYLDQISSFNFHLLSERKRKEMFMAKPSPKMTKAYIYFIFYKKLMMIERNKETKSVQLKQKVFNEEITDKYYILALENMKKHAITNQIPFILIYDEVQNIEKIEVQKVIWQKQFEFYHLLAYNYILNSQKYKLVADAVYQNSYLSNKYEKPMKLTFNKSSYLYAALGQCRSEQIIQKKKIVQNNEQKGYLLAHVQYCRQFIKERIQNQQKNT